MHCTTAYSMCMKGVAIFIGSTKYVNLPVIGNLVSLYNSAGVGVKRGPLTKWKCLLM